MIERVVAQLILAFTVTRIIPIDAANLEWQAGIPVPEDSLIAPLFAAQPTVQLPAAGERVLPPRKTDVDSYGVVTSAQSAIVVDVASGSVLFQKQPDDVRPIGSITKLMTGIVFLETDPDLRSYVKIVEDDYVGGGRLYVNFNDPILLEDVLAASIVGSDNTATTALQRLSGLSRDEFVARMNAKAQELGMVASSFGDPSGIGNNNLSTARELALLLYEAKQHDVLRDFMTMSQVTIAHASGLAVPVESTDMLLESYLNASPYGITGGKTGYIPEAGYCFITSVEKDGDEVFVAVLGAESIVDRFTDAKALATWAFSTFTWPEL